MLEVELKFRCEDTGRLEADLSRLGARRADQVRQVDQYFNHPQRDFAQTDEAVRIRDTNGQTSLTYKGPLVDRESKTRREIELDLAGDQAREKLGEWLLAVGFRPVLQVEKTRQAWTLSRGGRDVEVVRFDSGEVCRNPPKAFAIAVGTTRTNEEPADEFSRSTKIKTNRNAYHHGRTRRRSTQ